jgi:O-antigen ligase
MITATITVAMALYALICHRSLRLGALVLIASLPLYLIRFDIGPLPTTFLELQFCLLFIFWLLSLRQESNRKILKESIHHPFAAQVGAGAALLAIGGLLGMLQTSDMLSSFGVWKSYLIEPMLFALILLTVERKANIKNVHKSIPPFLVAFSIPVLLVSIVAIFQMITGITIPDDYFVTGRATAFYSYPNAVGLFTGPIAVMLTTALSFKKIRNRLTKIELTSVSSAALLGLVSLFASQTEAAIIAVTITLVGFALILSYTNYRKRFAIYVVSLIVLVGALLVIPISRDLVVQKLTLQDWSGQTRIAGWQETSALLTSETRTFILGTGMNSFPAASAPFHTHDYLEIFQYPHNIFLNIWTELGLIGLTGFLLIAVAIIRASVINGSRDSKLLATDYLLLAPLIAMTIHGLVDVPYFKNDLAFLTWTFIALLIAASAHSIDSIKK